MTSPTVDQAPTSTQSPWLPPRWFIRGAWVVHRAIHRFTGGRRGLSTPQPGSRFGHLKLTTVGRRSGQPREAILGYVEDGPNLVTLAMNGWSSPEPAWWLNLQANPEATVELKTGPRSVRARAAVDEERDRLWAKVREHRGYGDMDGYSQRRSGETAVVVLEPRDGATEGLDR
jgi:deazaflavin-dependent oxidoreductase (nitroreductase family)